jgi:glutathione peroxidase
MSGRRRPCSAQRPLHGATRTQPAAARRGRAGRTVRRCANHRMDRALHPPAQRRRNRFAMQIPILCAALLALTAACGSPPPTGASAAPGGAANPAPTAAAPTPAPAATAMNDVYALKASSLAGQSADLSSYRGKVTLVVNVASECGYTPQYKGLQKLHEEYAAKGFAVLAFPSNEFGGQEPGSPEQIQQFCSKNYGVTFPLFAKCATKPGAGQSPVFAALQQATGKSPNWNFCKYLVGKDGAPIAFYASRTAPDDAELRAAIDKALGG